ncbi:hypothetical protein MCOR27_008736 [Pyricularia oryzae]|uniref:Zinc finger C2H2 LYAR-type domain-containing protein n=3 Tax=Pyricularia TaxID=48558 RepID=A0ABQ8NPB1_PYRGI|nr:hypothetical protein MCOR01_008004 [Pyricularia oryzae]KAI6299562.1 hypothetical protein MCOR33_004577 [Pyricularia grisea]KAI6259721.1 hypothetical protein MCOR19_003969 [Pyricularia oryzae]KAI6271640.1 hypothetical protein MCOR27_008736 [Pyricularia oryzae]KAI6283351.1 hypothetical protein MCOR26_002455 [Pyricularia oryzae]
MVSFSCENCGDVLTKKKLDPHRSRCHGATFTCIDCMTYFYGTDYRSHTSCISEEQKYQGALYKPKQPKRNQQNNQFENETPAAPEPPKDMAHVAYVEDAPEENDDYEAFNDDVDDVRPRRGPMPEAPTPPSAMDEHPNVFDFLVGNPTPKASHSDLRAEANIQEPASESTQLVRFKYDSAPGVDDKENAKEGELVKFGSMETPANKDKKKSKDKKRKRLHVDTRDAIMTDAPPVLHSGLTGGLKGLMRGPSVFPPSPGDSADAAETPASPLKKSRHSKHGRNRVESIGNNLISMLTSSKPAKTKKRKHGSPSAKKSSKHKSEHRRSSSDGEKPKNLIEYRPGSKDSSKDGDGKTMVVFNKYQSPADHLLSLVNKGPDSERGLSMNKTLKRYHRERSESGSSLGKLMEEKELWRSLRLRKNDRGEIVLFCV